MFGIHGFLEMEKPFPAMRSDFEILGVFWPGTLLRSSRSRLDGRW
jgi:hypothetical protein